MSKFVISGFYDEICGDLNTQLSVLKELGEKYICPRTVNGKNISAYSAEDFISTVKHDILSRSVFIT
ncbi:MAG: hypothetical protein EOM87_08975 [Clostridia bacterium]|nr:hypothetical protein [Clostridia bacterium]